MKWAKRCEGPVAGATPVAEEMRYRGVAAIRAAYHQSVKTASPSHFSALMFSVARTGDDPVLPNRLPDSVSPELAGKIVTIAEEHTQSIRSPQIDSAPPLIRYATSGGWTVIRPGGLQFFISNSEYSTLRELWDRHHQHDTLSIDRLADDTCPAWCASVYCVVARWTALTGGLETYTSIPEEVYKTLTVDWGVQAECWSTPVSKTPKELPRLTLFPDTDVPFGSFGSFFSFRPKAGSFVITIPHYDTGLARVYTRIKKLLTRAHKRSRSLMFIAIVPHRRDCDGGLWGPFMQCKFGRGLVFLPQTEMALVQPNGDTVRSSHHYGVFFMSTEPIVITAGHIARLREAFRAMCPTSVIDGLVYEERSRLGKALQKAVEDSWVSRSFE